MAASNALPEKNSTSNNGADENNSQTQQPQQQTPQEDEDEQAVTEEGVKGQTQKDMKAVTGYQEERDEEVDEVSIVKAIRSLEESQKQRKEQRALVAKTKAISIPPLDKSIVLSKEEVTLIMNEFNVSKEVAERNLRENKGDLRTTIRRLITV